MPPGRSGDFFKSPAVLLYDPVTAPYFQGMTRYFSPVFIAR